MVQGLVVAEAADPQQDLLETAMNITSRVNFYMICQ